MVGATLSVLVLLAVFFLSRRLSHHEQQQATQQHRQQQLLEQFIRGQSTLRTARAESRALACWWERFHALYTPGQRIPPSFRALEMLYSTVPPLLLAGVLATLTTAAPTLSPGHQIAALVVVAQVQAALLPLAFVGQEVLATGPAFARIQPLLATAAESAPPRCHPGRLRGAITVDGVCFGYPSSEAGDTPPVLDRVSLHIEPGEWVVLTGPSGAGKSTLVRLLLGFALPQAGAIFYDGYAVGHLDMPAVREQMGVVLQDQRIVPGNLWYNIAGERDLSRQQVEEAAALVGLDALIRQMPMGLKTPLTEGGVTLSGGQRQQIFLARALVAQPAIVLLDEATSALDGRLHQRIITHLASMSATRILITHDARLAAQADRVVTLERGGRVYA
jgi:ABC-type bacteriocin/lantibiotic exporter with double-glycine peptidase domain